MIAPSLSWATGAPLVIFSGRSDRFVKPVLEQFTAKTGILTVLHTGSSTALLNKLQLEGARSEADLYISNDAGNLQAGSDMGLFKPMTANLYNSVPANLHAGDGSWVGLSARARVLVVNTNAKDVDFVQSVFDLADPRLKGKLAITNSSNESYIAGVTVYLESAGVEKTRQWLDAVKANVAGEVFNKHSQIVRAVAQGKKSVGLVNHYYIYRHLDQHPAAPIRIVMPDQGKAGMGVAWNVAGAAIAKHSKNVGAAEQLLAFLLSVEGQKTFAEANREYPVRPGVAAASQIPAAGSFRIADVPMSALGKQRNATLDLIEQLGMP
ncbi:MAG: extracellular solute-binding protein [Gammaproteobacteria bacterium]